MTTKYVYMIQRNSDGLFSSGGQYVHWSKKGKAWSSIGALKNHLHQFHDWRGQKLKDFPYTDCTIVEMERVVVIKPSANLDDWNVENLFDKLRAPIVEKYHDK
jgi:hypothetical protein